MKKRVLSILAMVTVTLGMNAAVGDDLTSKYLTNADFKADTPLRQGICTYDYDMSNNGVEYFGQQAVTGWTALNLSDNVLGDKNRPENARAAGIFELGKQYLMDYTGNQEDLEVPIFLGGTAYLTPAPDDGITEGNVLGMIAVWSAKLQYTQALTLPAGAYTIEIPVYNSGGTTAVVSSTFGFIADNGTSYLYPETTWEQNTWTTMTINLLLQEKTSGVISLGYAAADAGSGGMPHLYVGGVKILEGDKSALEKEEVDALKETLLEVLEAAEELSVDASAEQAVYDDDNATLEQVQAAIDSLREKNASAMTDFTDFFINNAHFAQGTPLDNGVCTYDYDMSDNGTTYYGMQPIDSWTASTPTDNTLVGDRNNPRTDGKNAGASGLFAVGSPETVWLGSKGDVVPATKADGSTEGNVFGFISVWMKSSSYTQNVTLPAGSYTITIPTYNERGTGAIAKNLCGFIADNGDEYLASTTTFPVGVWSNETIKFKLEEETSGVITIGYEAANAGSGSMPHLFIDEFTLMFNGLTDIAPSLIALNGAVRNGETFLDSEEPYEASLKDVLQEAINAATDLKDANSSDDEANVAAATAINNAITTIKSSIATYKKFIDFINGKLTNTIDKYSESEDLADFAGELSDDKDAYTTAWEDGSYTSEQINEIINGFTARVSAAVKEALAKAVEEGGAHDIDVTCLYADKNLDYANSTVEGWNNETGTSAFLSRVQTAEVWNQSNFNVYQTLENLPAGVYELRVPGMYRSADNPTNYQEYQDRAVVGSAYIYVGGNKQLMHNVAEFASDTQDANHSGVISEGELYAVNSNDNAHYYFYDQKDEDVTNVVTGALAETGTLTVGVKGENLEGNAWAVWGAFSIIYKGTEGMADALYTELQSKMEDANALLDDASRVTEADMKINEALTEAENCSDSDVDAIVTAIKGLEDAMAYTKESVVLYDEIQNLYAIYSEYLVGMVESDDESFPTLLENISLALEDGFESNDEIVSYKDQIQNTWATYVQAPVLSTSTEENPGDISAAILNRGFEGIINDQTSASGEGNGDYWTKTRVGGNDFGYQAGVYESYNTDTFDIHQTISGLAKGYYRVRVQSFFRAANTGQECADAFAGDSIKSTVYFYANEVCKAVVNPVERADDGAMVGTEGEIAVTYGENPEFYIPQNRTACAAYFEMGYYWNTINLFVEDGTLTIGLKKDTHVAGDWCPFDNFELYYLGTEAPTGIKNVEQGSIASAVSTRIYTIDGQQISRLQKGVNIIKATLADGTVRVSKVLVR